MTGALKGANLALAFLLELVSLVAFAFWASGHRVASLVTAATAAVNRSLLAIWRS